MPKAFDALLALVENPGDTLEKDELMKRVWPNTVVEENNLTQNISALRNALGRNSGGTTYIENIPCRGYRSVGRKRPSPSKPYLPRFPSGRRVSVHIEQCGWCLGHFLPWQ